jgi:Ger(x)C family germination protein
MLLLLSPFILSGCYDKLEVSDTIVVIAHGWDIQGDNKLLSAQLALTPPREGQLQRDPKYMTLCSTAPSFAQAARELSLTLPRQPLWSMADTIVISEKLALRDTTLFIDTATRNPHIRYNVKLFVARGVTPAEIFEVQVPPENYSGTALEKIIRIQTGQAGIYMPIDLKDFIYRNSTEGIEPVIPQIVLESQKGQKGIRLQGTAVFKGHQMVGELDPAQTRGLALMKSGAINSTIFNIKNPLIGREEEPLKMSNNLCLELTSYRVKVKPLINGSHIKMQIVLEGEGNIVEDNNTSSICEPETVQDIEKEAARALKQDIQMCIKQAQGLNSDIMGWGLAINRIHPRTWQKIRDYWPEIFPGIPANIQVKYRLNQPYLQKDAFLQQ